MTGHGAACAGPALAAPFGRQQEHRRAATTANATADAAERFRAAAAQFATGVTVVTAVASSVPVGMTVNAFATASLDPMLLLVCLRDGCRLLDALHTTAAFAVTVLAQDQEAVARRFADPARPVGPGAFTGLEVTPSDGGCPILLGGVAYFECRVAGMHAAGDHRVVIGEVRSMGTLEPKPPLLFVNSTFVAGADAAAGLSIVRPPAVSGRGLCR